MDELAHILRMIELIDYIRLLSKGVSWESSRYQSFKSMIEPLFHTWLVQTILFTVSVATLYDTISSIVIIHAVLELVYRYADALQYYCVFSLPCIAMYAISLLLSCSVPLIMCSSSHLQYPRSRDDSGSDPATCSLAAVANRARYNEAAGLWRRNLEET